MRKHEKNILYISFAIIAVTLGLCSYLYFINGIAVKKAEFTQNIPNLCNVSVKENQWKYIVIHHSATAKGNAAAFDYYHREKKGWQYGLAYHFVIGNGSLSRDGEIEIGERWKKQIHGAHTANMACNREAIGICLVGNFENEGVPTDRQIESLANLIQHLSKKYNILLSNVILHNQVYQKDTACPGKNFPFAQLKTKLIQLAAKKSPDSRKLQ